MWHAFGQHVWSGSVGQGILLQRMFFDQHTELLIQQAIRNGELDDLPGEGKPLELDDDSLIAPELRMANRILRNSGHLPEAVQLRQEISRIEQLISSATREEDTNAGLQKLLQLQLRLERTRGQASNPLEEHRYSRQLQERFRA